MSKKIRNLVGVLVVILLALIGWQTDRTYADNNYGSDAYYYMEYLQTHYPQRAVANPNLDAAAAWLKQEVTKLGYQYASQPFSIPAGEGIVINGENIIFSKSGASDKVILVGAHYDSVLTNGTDDNATGVGLLLETAKRLATNQSLPYTVRFVLFSAEEPGCYGSQYYVDNLSTESRQQIVCMINLDTLGAGDYMYLYGGGVNEAGQPVRTWAVEQALNASVVLGLSMSYHPDVNAQYPVPVKHTASDQQAFDRAGIPYLYFEASNWNGGDHNNFYQTSNPAITNGKMMHIAAYENLAFYNQTFGNRIANHLTAYSTLLDYMLNHMTPGVGSMTYSYEERSEKVWAVSDVRIRQQSSVTSEVLAVLKTDESILRTGYHDEWSRVSYNGETGYIKTEYLTAEKPEGITEEMTTQEVTTEAPTETQPVTTEPPTTPAPTTESQPMTTEAPTQPSTAQVITQAPTSQGAFEGGVNVNSLLQWVQGNQMVRVVMIIGIVAVAVLLCLLIFLFQNNKR